MADASYRGVSALQDSRFKDKQAELLRTLRFPAIFSSKVDMSRVEFGVIKTWMAGRVTELLGFEDDVVLEYAAGMLEERYPDARRMQIQLTGFLEAQTGAFMEELWTLLVAAQSGPGGIAPVLIERKKEELRRRRADDERVLRAAGARARDAGWGARARAARSPPRDDRTHARAASSRPRRPAVSPRRSRSPTPEYRARRAGPSRRVASPQSVPPATDEEDRRRVDQLREKLLRARNSQP
jgi:serine/arginine repetitive matrix protein 1